MSLYEVSVPQFTKMLRNLSAWLDKSVEYAKSKNFDPTVLLNARLAPDQYPLVRQIQGACDAAKFAAARLTAKEPPKNPDTEQTVDELKARIATTVAYLETFTAKDFEGVDKRVVPLAWAPGKGLLGTDFLVQNAMANFYFHLTHAYAILRHNGVDLGKRDYLGGLPFIDV